MIIKERFDTSFFEYICKNIFLYWTEPRRSNISQSISYAWAEMKTRPMIISFVCPSNKWTNGEMDKHMDGWTNERSVVTFIIFRLRFLPHWHPTKNKSKWWRQMAGGYWRNGHNLFTHTHTSKHAQTHPHTQNTHTNHTHKTHTQKHTHKHTYIHTL